MEVLAAWSEKNSIWFETKNDFTTHDLAMMFLNIIKKTALDI